ncbi:MAG: DUF4238 domain-containing protein [Chloroflexi bacterium]|nr:DUF4238 domain-containing protein [Chloroflexota bacterium]
MNNPKRHHYIPRMLLKHFVDERGNLYCFDRDSRDRCVTRRNPKTLFTFRHLYSFHKLDGERDYSTEEDFLRAIENKASPIVEKIVCNARKAELSYLTPDENSVWVEFFFTLWKRLPALRDSSASSQLRSEQNQQWYREIKGIADGEAIDFYEMEEFLKQEAWPRAIPETNELMETRILPTLRRMSLCVVIVEKEQSGFVIGSNPIVKALPHLDLDHPEVEIWTPLAHDVAVVFRHGRPDELYYATDEFIQRLNERVFEQSKEIAGRSREQIKSLKLNYSNLDRST